MNTNALKKAENSDLAKPNISEVSVPEVSAVDKMLQTAIETQTAPEIIKQFMDLKERAMDKEAEMEFNHAMQKFQSLCPPVNKTKEGVYASYAPLDEIKRTIMKPLKRCELSYKWESNVQGEENPFVTSKCIIKHTKGFSDFSIFTAPVDMRAIEKGANLMQRYAQAETFANRRSLCDVLGITSADEDLDGDVDIEIFITEKQIDDLEVLIDDVGVEKERFLNYCKVDSLQKILAKNYPLAVKALEEKRN